MDIPITASMERTPEARMKLLIVDDHPAMRRMIGKVVSDMVSDIEECGDGAEALAAYSRCRPDWVLMDIEMSRTDGITATREILLSYPSAKVVIVTRHDDEQLRAAARNAGACGYILKENLIAIRELLGEP
jgi:DNA-binding NarL/FixJ family response regulator